MIWPQGTILIRREAKDNSRTRILALVDNQKQAAELAYRGLGRAPFGEGSVHPRSPALGRAARLRPRESHELLTIDYLTGIFGMNSAVRQESDARSFTEILQDYKCCAYATYRGPDKYEKSRYIAIFRATCMTETDVTSLASYFSEVLKRIHPKSNRLNLDIGWSRCGPPDEREVKIVVSGPVMCQQTLTALAWVLHTHAGKAWADPLPALSEEERHRLVSDFDLSLEAARSWQSTFPRGRARSGHFPVTNIPAAGEDIERSAHGFGLSEDWWAVIVGLGLVIAAIVAFERGSSIGWLAVTPAKWSTLGAMLADISAQGPRYIALFVVWTLLLGVPLKALGFNVRQFLPAFFMVSMLSALIFVIGQWSEADRYNLEPPLIALIVGMAIANFRVLPSWMDAGFRVEYYIKTGIVLLGATIPLTLLALAGPVALVQASIVSFVTFSVIYLIATGMGLDKRLSATLGAGGAICGVSAAIAVSGAVGAKKQDAPVAITLVVAWAIVLIFVLPYLSLKLALPAAVAGAWIGTSELADAAGLAATQTVAGFADHGKLPGSPESAIAAFTLVKVLGRDVWIGIWAFALSLFAAAGWEETAIYARPNALDIWRRFPKFVLGFVAASILVTVFTTSTNSYSEFMDTYSQQLLGPLKNLRTWAFIFTFLSIGLTTRFRDLAGVGIKPLLAFSIGVLINVVIGFALSAVAFSTDWQDLYTQGIR